MAVLVSVVLLGACSPLFVPGDAQETCIVSQSEFEGWFESGSVTLDGVVEAADSVNFPDDPNCTFFKWTEQMYLWLTSPAPPRYGGGGGIILDSPEFYDVSPPDANNKRTFIPHTSGDVRVFSIRDAQLGAHRLPLVTDSSGKVFEVVEPVLAPSGLQLIRNAEGERVEIERAILGEDGRPQFFDRGGEIIRGARPIIDRDLLDQAVVQPFTIAREHTIFLSTAGNVIDVEQGQAGGGDVLMTQNGSLVYYLTTVNNVFAYFRTGVANGDITPTLNEFPTEQQDLDEIINFAAQHGKTLLDPEALAIEVKSSWIEASTLADTSGYITIQATIPTYNQSDPQKWTVNGQKTVEMAMVGIHVVGSTKGHPEMLWGTFEHVRSTPNATYSYNDQGNNTKTISQDTSGVWLFSQSNATGPFNQSRMRMIPGSHDIEAFPGFTIGPTDIIRWKAWGSAFSNASINTEVIAINNSVRGKLAAGDVRANYVQTGTTWTIFGQAPSGGNQVGTHHLANTTMETFQQGISNMANGTNCFSCHITNKTSVSHVFGSIDPLFP